MGANLAVFSLGFPRGRQGQAGAPGADKTRSPKTGPCAGIDLEVLGVYGH